MDKTFALFMTALLLLSGCLGADEDSVADAIILIGCNDATALNYDVNNSAPELVNTTALCASEEALEQGIMEFIQLMDEGPGDNITTTIGYSMQVSEVFEDNLTWTYLETTLMTPTGLKSTTEDNYGEEFSIEEIILSGNQIQYSTSTNESSMTVRMTHAHGFMEFLDMEDNDMEDDDMEDEEDEDPASEDYTPYFTINATFEDFSITEAGMTFTGLLNVAGAPFGELVVHTTTDFAVTGFTLVDVNEANNYVSFTLINSGEAVVDETIALSALPFLLLSEEMMGMFGGDMGDGGDDNNGEEQFMCDDGELIDADWVNDGEEDCADGSDEFEDNGGNNDGFIDSWTFNRDVAACDENNDSMVDYQEFINCIETDLTNDGYGSMNATDVGADLMFEIGDMDNNSLLNESELYSLNQMINSDDEAPSPEEAMNASDADGNGTVSWSEFTAEWNTNWTESGNLSDDSEFESQLYSAFNDSDMDNSSELNLSELELFIDEVDMIMNDMSNEGTDEGTDEDTGDSETLYIMAFMPGEGVLDDYSLVLANCVMSEQSMTPESCEEGVYSVVLSSIVMDGNSTSQPGVMFMDTDASGTLSSGDMIIIDHSQLNLTEEWNTPRLHSAEANAYADENPMMPGFTGIIATLGLLGAALSRRE
ncbi:MAG: hypothetical protein QNL81_05115 [Euryarchaeota archaeon]